MSSSARRIAVTLRGIVQGVGFRPFVYALARRHGLVGAVWNDAAGVQIEAQGDDGDVARFLVALLRDAPPLAVIADVENRDVALGGEAEFTISPSRSGTAHHTPVSPDIATCDDCLRELWDPSDRRYLYPFINCTRCGPRYTIVEAVPYDRARTTMASFAMCDECQREYDDPKDRRFHAQPTACAACGPRLALRDRSWAALAGDPIASTAAMLRDAQVVAIKGLGGYHLATDARNERAVAALRARKHREEKPFALMVASLDAARALVEMDEVEAALLAGIRRPIVLLRRRLGADIAPSVAPGTRDLGIMLPYTPIHHLVLREQSGPIVLTSGNVSDEPIAYRAEDAQRRLASIADAFLDHDRPIQVRTDDSVVRSYAGAPMLLRRSRGHAPQPIVIPQTRRHVLACGAELKSTICAAKERFAFVSHHLGDLENLESYRSFCEATRHVTRLFGVEPEIIAHDMHPEYLSTKWAREQTGVALCAVQHHHAHIASCLSDNGEVGPAIGVAYDGLGYGGDGTWWGGEILVADLKRFERVGHWSLAPMPGGVAAIREPWRMALAHLDAAFDGQPPPLPIAARHGASWDTLRDIATRRPLSPLTSSMGRLFDAVAALIGLRDEVCHEGQAAADLEQRAAIGETGAYPVALCEAGDQFTLPCSDLVRSVVGDLRAGVDPALIAARFHHGVAAASVLACEAARARSGIGVVALSGGVFQNVRLLHATAEGLHAAGFRVLVHRQVPPNDGGISLGQAVIAASQR